MSETKIEANAENLESLFSSECLFQVPFFQRPYEWKPKQRNDFLRDLQDQSELDESERSHFLGAIVLAPVEEINPELGHPKVFQVIDGQQRLTTALLTGFALLHLASSASKQESDVDRAETSKKISRYFESYLVFGTKSTLTGELRIGPSLEDSAQVRELQQRIKHDFSREGLSVTGAYPEQGHGSTLVDAYRTIKAKIKKDSLGPDHTSGSALELFTCLLRSFKVVAIQLPTNEDPHQIFDSLNTKGLDLTSSAVIRNYVFSKYTRDEFESARSLYDGGWALLSDSLGSRFDQYLFPYSLILDPKTGLPRLWLTPDL